MLSNEEPIGPWVKVANFEQSIKVLHATDYRPKLLHAGKWTLCNWNAMSYFLYKNILNQLKNTDAFWIWSRDCNKKWTSWNWCHEVKLSTTPNVRQKFFFGIIIPEKNSVTHHIFSGIIIPEKNSVTVASHKSGEFLFFGSAMSNFIAYCVIVYNAFARCNSFETIFGKVQ